MYICLVPQLGNVLCDMQTPTNGPALLPDFQEIEAFRHMSTQQQAIPAIENRNLSSSSSYLPSSPLHRQSASSTTQQPNIFNFGFSPTSSQSAAATNNDHQFQAQLIQQLQNINNTYHNQKCNSLYGGQQSLFPPSQQAAAVAVAASTSPSFRQSVAGSSSQQPQQQPSYSSSPILGESPSRTVAMGSVGKSDDSHLIKPLSQGETITATDGDGRVRVIVPVGEEEMTTAPPSVPRLEPPPPGHKRSKEASPTKLG